MQTQSVKSSAGVTLLRVPSSGRGPLSASIFAGLVRGLEFCVLAAAGLLAGYGIAAPLGVMVPETFVPCVVAAALAASCCLGRFGGDAVNDLCAGRLKLRGAAVALLAGGIVLCAAAYATDPAAGGIGWPTALLMAAWLAVGGLALGLTRAGVGQFAGNLLQHRQLGRRVALLGAGASASAFMARLDGTRHGLLHVVGFYRDAPDDGQAGPANLANLGALRDLVADGQHGRLDAVVVTLPPGDTARIGSIAALLRPLATEVYVAGPAETASPGLPPELRGLPVAVLSPPPLSDWQRFRKRAIDLVGSAVLLAFLAPVLLLIAVLVKTGSAGPVLFRQTRIGYQNQPFTCLKFRSMYDHAADLLADRQTTRDDPRVTRVGKWLRRTSLDELPQLVNVLLGDMSLVGPRPHAPNTRAEGRFFADVVSDYAMRHRVKPGITGWAQVNGWRGETATVEQIEQRVRHDLYYIRNWSLVFDIRILLMTATRGFSSKQAY